MAEQEPFDFSAIPKQADQTCRVCGEEFLGYRNICDECSFHEDHPEMAPGYWTWTNSSRGWMITARWREKEEWPESGTSVTVHRKNGTTSQATIEEVESHRYDMAANLVLTCTVRPA